MTPNPRSLQRTLLLSAATVSLLAAGPALAVSGPEAIRTATAACLDSAGKQGWRTDLAKVISSRSLDADRVEVVFDLTRDGTNSARLTCPYSLSKGVATSFGAAATGATAAASGATAVASKATATASDAVTNAAATALNVVPAGTAVDAGTAVNGGRAWWLLLPLGLGLLAWAGLRGSREGLVDGAAARGDRVVTTGTSTSRNILVEAHAADGDLEVHERADIATRILRRVRNGERLALTGHRLHDWLEVASGGWVRDIDVRYDRSAVRFS